MATTWLIIKTRIQAIIKDADFQSGGTNEGVLLADATDAQMKICELVDIRRMLKTATVTTTTDDYIYDMPSDFLRLSPETRAIAASNDYFTPIETREYLNWVDPDHDQTTTATNGPTFVVLDGSELLIYPMWAGDITIQDYIRRPTLMTVDGSDPDILSEGIDADILVKDAIIDYVCYKVYDTFLQQDNKAQKHLSRFKGGIAELKSVNPTFAVDTYVRSAFGR